MRTSLHSLAWLLWAASCAAPAAPTPEAMDERDRTFHAPLAASDRDGGRPLEVLANEELSLEDALHLADALNPRLESARQEVSRAALLDWQDSLFPNPTLFLEVEDFPAEEGRSLGRAERGIGISQAVPVGGRLGAAGEVGEKRRDLAAIRYLLVRREILVDVKTAFISALAANATVDLTRRTRDLSRQLHDLTEERYRARAVPEMELLKAAVRLARTEADHRSAESLREIALRRLLARIGSEDLPARRLAGDLVARFEAPGLETLRGTIVTGHPAIEAARGARTVAEAELRLAKARRVPDVGLAISYGWTPDEDRILEGGVSVPLPIFDRNQGRVRDAEIRVTQGDLAIAEARTRLALSLEEIHRSFLAARDRVETFDEDILPRAEKARTATEEGHRAGKFSYLDVIDAEQTLEEARRAHLSTVEEMNLRAAELEGITGTPIRAVR